MLYDCKFSVFLYFMYLCSRGFGCLSNRSRFSTWCLACSACVHLSTGRLTTISLFSAPFIRKITWHWVVTPRQPGRANRVYFKACAALGMLRQCLRVCRWPTSTPPSGRARFEGRVYAGGGGPKVEGLDKANGS